MKIALEKNRYASPYVEEAKALKAAASSAKTPKDLLPLTSITKALLTASGLSDKALGHLADDDKQEAVVNLIEQFLEPAGNAFIDELVFRFLLTRGDSLGGKMRNLAAKLLNKLWFELLSPHCQFEMKDFNGTMHVQNNGLMVFTMIHKLR